MVERVSLERIEQPVADPGDLPRQRRTRSVRSLMFPLVAALAVAAIWEFLSMLDPDFWPEIVLSRPTEILPALAQALVTPFVWQNFWVTVQEAVLGFLLGTGTAFALGVLIALIGPVRQALYPLIVFLESTPRVALAPVFIAWFGFGMPSKVALAMAICFFPVLVNTITGLSIVDENAVLLMRSLRATRFQVFVHLRLFSAMPSIFAGLKISSALAVVGAVVGELTGANEGVGHLIKSASFQFRMADVFAYVAMLGIFGLLLFKSWERVERRLVFWHTDWEKEQ